MSRPSVVATRPALSLAAMLVSADGRCAVSACLTTFGSFRCALVTITVTRVLSAAMVAALCAATPRAVGHPQMCLISLAKLGIFRRGPRSIMLMSMLVAMAFKLIESAQDRRRAVNAPHLVALVRAGATFINGKLVQRPGEDPQPQAA
jgi:hypothetical protein